MSVSGGDLSVNRIDISNVTSEKYKFEGLHGIQAVYGGRVADLLVAAGDSLYRIYLGNDAYAEEVLVFTDYGIDCSKIQMINELTDGCYSIVLKDRSAVNVDRVVLSPAVSVVEKRNITLACLKCSSYLRFAVARFNENSDDTRISIKEYYDRYSIDTSMEEVLNMFNSDLMDQSAGDIICLDGIEQVGDREAYLNKGMFLDLYEIMDNDDDFDKSDYYTNVWRVNETGGKLYTLVSVFTLNTKYALRSDVGDVNHLDEDVLLSVVDGTALYGPDYNQDMFLHDLCVFSLGDISDTKAAIYDTEMLERYLTLAAELSDYKMYNDDGELTHEYEVALIQEEKG